MKKILYCIDSRGLVFGSMLNIESIDEENNVPLSEVTSEKTIKVDSKEYT